MNGNSPQKITLVEASQAIGRLRLVDSLPAFRGVVLSRQVVTYRHHLNDLPNSSLS